MVTTVTLIMWVFLTDGTQTYDTAPQKSLSECLDAQEEYMRTVHEMVGDNATIAAGCMVRPARAS